MPRRERIVAGNIYHVLSRGVDKRKIFIDPQDHLRFIHDLFEFNDTAPLNNNFYRFTATTSTNSNDSRSHYINGSGQRPRQPRTLLVEILIFCLMPNHYHLLLRPRFDDGLSKFISRLNIGYAKYFNEKYKRTGTLFEGRFKSIAVSRDSHFLHIPYYIHMNPLDLVAPEWRKRDLRDHRKAMRFLENYRWSSFLDYIGKANFPSVTQRDFLNRFFGGPEAYKTATTRWLKELDINEFKSATLE